MNSTVWYRMHVLTPYTPVFAIAVRLVSEGGVGLVAGRV